MDRLAWLIAPELGREKLTLLVLCVWLFEVLGANLTWRWKQRPGRHSTPVRGVEDLLLLVYRLGVPLVLFWRGAGMREMGIPTSWVVRQGNGWPGLGSADIPLPWALSQVVLVWLSGVLLWAVLGVWYARACTRLAVYVPMRWWNVLLNTLSMQMSWALYRLVAMLWTTDPTTVALVIVSLVVSGWLLDPHRRRALFLPTQSVYVVRDGVLLLLFIWGLMAFGVLPLLIVLHAAWLWAGEHIFAFISQKYVPRGDPQTS